MSSGFQPRDFIKFCEDLYSQINKFDLEPALRTVVNRCYIAAYVTAKTALIAKNHRYTNTFKDYKRVENDLGKEYGKGMQDKLLSLRSSRITVDYDYPCRKQLDMQYAQRRIRLAQHIISKL